MQHTHAHTHMYMYMYIHTFTHTLDAHYVSQRHRFQELDTSAGALILSETVRAQEWTAYIEAGLNRNAKYRKVCALFVRGSRDRSCHRKGELNWRKVCCPCMRVSRLRHCKCVGG